MPSSSDKKNASRPQKNQADKGSSSREKSSRNALIEESNPQASTKRSKLSVNELLELDAELLFEPEHHSDIELDDAILQQGADINLGGKRMGGPTGGDLKNGGSGPAIGETHPANDDTADHYGSRAETQAALEGRIANLNTRQLKGW
jgi:hypothetical protein